MSDCARSFQVETARMNVCSVVFSEGSQPVSIVSAPRLTAPRSTLRRLISSTSARFSFMTDWSIGLRGRKIEGEGVLIDICHLFAGWNGYWFRRYVRRFVLDSRAAREHGQ